MKKHTTLRHREPGICVLNKLAVMRHKATAVCSAWRTLLVLLIGLLPMTSLQATDSTAILTPPAFKTSYMAELVQKDIDSLTKQEIDTVKFYAIALWQKIKSEKRILKAGQVSADKIQDFPVAVGDISPGTGTVDYAICFDKMVINATGKSVLQAYMVFAPPGGGDKAEPMVFMAKDVEITALGGISYAQLSMVGGFTLLKNNRFEVNIIGSQSGVIMDCNGFKSFNIGGEVVFDSTMIHSPEKKQIKGTFTLSAASWDDFLMSINFNYPFEINKAPGYIFTVTSATIDMSESRNPGTFPGSYIGDTPDLNAAPETWKGFHVTGINLQFPNKFSGQNTSPSVNLSNLIIDKEGVSVSVSVNNLISIENGNASGWAFSIDQFELKLLHNIPVEGSMAGKIKLPVMDDPLRYKGTIDTEGNYHLHVSTTDSIRFDLWKAGKITLSQAAIYLDYKDEKFTASAKLTGEMTVAPNFSSDSNGSISIPSIKFEELLIQTKSPYISATKFGFDGQINFKVAGFNANINGVTLVSETTSSGENRVGIAFGIHVKMTNIASSEFGADGHLTVYGKRSLDANERHRWVYDDVELNKLGIEVKNEVFAFKGDLELFKNKPTYGSGFRADLTLELKKGFKFSVQAMALFGTAKDSNGQDYSYWQVDALTEFNPGIVVGTVTLNGFGGGVYERMRQDAASTNSRLGMSLSGINYVPDVTMGLGIRASVTCSFGSESLVSAKVGLEFAFRAEGGLKYISFDGEATVFPSKGLIGDLADLQENLGDALNSISAKNKVMDALVQSTGLENIAGIQLLPKDSTTKMPGIITAKLHIEYLFDESTFHADLKININVFSILTGGGLAQMHFAPDKWYVRIGEPNNRMGVSLNLAIFKINVGSYFMVGHEIPAAPAPPAELARILNVSQKELNYMRDDDELKSGKGIAFGLDINTDFKTDFLMFYANLTAGMGFDIMLTKYENVHCEGQTQSIGINGWYANGQIYAYMSGSVGIKIKIFKIRKDINILSLGAASLLQAKFPHPFWMRGMVGGYYSVLNGKIKGRCNFKIEFGDDCKKVQTDPDNSYAFEDIEAIGAITPVQGSDGISLTSPIKVNFLTPINKVVDITDEETNETEYIRVRFKSEESLVTVNGTNTVVPGNWQLSSDARSAAYISDQLLPKGAEIKVKVVVGFSNLNGGEVTTENGTAATEVKTAIFKTDTSEVRTIPLENIAYSYPLIKQANYYPGESSKGFIKLLKKQDQLFSNQNNTAAFVNGSTRIPVSSLVYSEGLITFDMPSSLVANTAYDFEIKSESGSKIVSYAFRTSFYNTLKEKIENTFTVSALSTPTDSIALNNPQEPFDVFELEGSPGIPQLIELEADLNANSWYTTYIKSYYETPEYQEQIEKRLTTYKDIQTRGIELTQYPNGIIWEGTELPSSRVTLKYRVPFYIGRNNSTIKTYSRSFCEDNPDLCNTWIFTPQTPGYYQINYRYILPNGTPGASSGTIAMQYQN